MTTGLQTLKSDTETTPSQHENFLVPTLRNYNCPLAIGATSISTVKRAGVIQNQSNSLPEATRVLVTGPKGFS